MTVLQMQQELIDHIRQVNDPALLASTLQFLNEKAAPANELTDAEWAEVLEAQAECDRGEYYTLEQARKLIADQMKEWQSR